MPRRFVLSVSTAVATVALAVGCGVMGPSGGNPMSFSIPRPNPGRAGDRAGLPAADPFCQSLATSAGAANKTWRAYLSTAAMNGQSAVNARDRIGTGPWTNAKGVVVATSVADLHSTNAKVGKDTSLTEKGDIVSGFGDAVNRHDILTGSRPDGTLAVPEPGKDTTCGNWTQRDGGSPIVGHHDRNGTNADPVANASWNSSHGTRGCSVDQLKMSGSAGLMYCFASN